MSGTDSQLAHPDAHPGDTGTDEPVNRLVETLRATFGFERYRPHQEEILQAIFAGRDVFAALPTGGGKSLCYQLPSVLLPRLTVVVSPLIALMQDQVRGARENGLAAAFLNSSLDVETARRVYREVAHGSVRLLYVSPERLAIDGFRETLQEWGVSLFAIDEAHCISEWGHEFRPDYRALATLRQAFPDTPIAAFTATATHHVQDDVIRLLGLREPVAIRGDFDRPEIFYRVERKNHVNEQIFTFIRKHENEPGIVYRATRKAVEETAAHLNALGISAVPYHAGLSDQIRRSGQEQFVRDDVQVVVATIAFGMGIDKSNVRWILHGDLPRSIEAYYQETGRAGRDGERADVCLFFSPRDITKIRYHIDRMQVIDERERAENSLRTILRYVDARVCRRTQLLRHFDQAHEGDCDGCDVCTEEVHREDMTVAAQKIMSAVLRTGERFGAHHLADIVSGNATDRVVQLRHEQIPTFGTGREQSKQWWLRLTQDLEAAGLLQRSDGPRSGFSLTERGRRVLHGKERFHTVTHTPPETPERSRPCGAARAEELFHRLRDVRLRLARTHRVPPYVIFSDKTLHVMARTRPTDLTGLLRVHGVGEVKAERYGADFLRAITEFPDNATPRK